MDLQHQPKITIHTLAYNSERYIRECAESVLNQTFPYFEWIVLDNGSTDRTGEILDHYAQTDARVKLFRNEKNTFIYNVPYNTEYVIYLENLKSEYICILDSDDYLDPKFLEVLYDEGVKHHADIVVGGSQMFWESAERQPVLRCPPDFHTDQIETIGDIFPQIYGCFRPMWGKLIRVPVYLKQLKYRKEVPVHLENGWDTIFNLDCLRFANSAAGVNKVLHYYRIRRDSFYNSQVTSNRYRDSMIIYKEGKKLLEMWGKWNEINQTFLIQVLYNSIRDYFWVVAFGKNLNVRDKFEVLSAILADDEIYNLLLQAGLLKSLFGDLQEVFRRLNQDLTDHDYPGVMDLFFFRLFKALEMVTAQTNIHNAALLYLSAVCDPQNKNRFGADFLFRFFRIMGQTFLPGLIKRGMTSAYLAANPFLLREILNGNYQEALQICMELPLENMQQLLQQELVKLKALPKRCDNMKEQMIRCISVGDFDQAADLVFEILEMRPLDKEALINKLYLLTAYGDIFTALETAEVLRVFYPDDGYALSFAAQAYASANLKEKSWQLFQQALSVCRDDKEKKQVEDAFQSYFHNVGVEFNR